MTIRPTHYLGSPGRPSWSADGKKVAVNLNRRAVVVEKDTATITATIGPEGANVGAPQFSPDGQHLAYDIYTLPPGAEKKKWAIQVAKADASEPEFLVNHGRRPRWSPDGESLAFSSYTDDFQTKVSVVGADGQNQRVVSQEPQSSNFTWSPDSGSIAYEAATMEGFQLRTHDLSSGAETIISKGDDYSHWDRSPMWAPSGRSLAFERRNKQFPAASLWMVDAQGNQEKVLLQEWADVVDPVFSPDGQSLVFGSNHGGRGGLDLFSMDLNDLSLTQLTDLPGDEHSPAFSPDGESLAYFNTDRKRESGDRHRLHFYDL